MELHQLRYFCAVAELGNFTRAAGREHVAQPSLSQQIIKLEGELGARLFDRLGRSVRLTHFGEAFLPRARAILRELGDAKVVIQEMTGSESGRVAIGSIPTISPYLLARRLPRFANRYPDIQITVLEEITPVLLRALHEGTIDLAFLAMPQHGPEYESVELKKEPLYLVVPSAHRLAKRRSVRLSEAGAEKFLLLKEGHCFRETAVSACKSARVQANVVFESGHFASILEMISAGLGVSIVPEMAVERRRGCRFIPIADPAAYRKVGIVFLKNRFFSRAQRAFVEHMKRSVRVR